MKSRIALVAVAGIVALGTWALWPRTESHTDHPAAVVKTASVAPGGETDTPLISPKTGKGAVMVKGIQAAVPPPGFVFKPLPPVTTPLRLAYTDLKEQARQGDPAAQCRLGYELKRCKEVSRRLETVRRSTGSGEVTPLDQQFAVDTSVCQDFTPDPDDEAWRYTLQAALNGNAAAALSFIFGPSAGLDPLAPLTTLEGWQAYRDYAPRLLQQEVGRGNAAAYLIAAQNSVRPSWSIPIIAQDPVQAAAYSFAVMPTASPSLRTQLQRQIDALNLGPADLAQAQQRAAPLAANLKVPASGVTDFSSGILSIDGKYRDGAECAR